MAAIASDDAVADAADDTVDDAVVVGAVEAADVVARTASATLTASLAAGPVGAPLESRPRCTHQSKGRDSDELKQTGEEPAEHLNAPGSRGVEQVKEPQSPSAS